MSRKTTFAERLRSSRCAAAFSIEAAAKAVKKTTITIRNWESGRTEPRAAELVKMARLYNRSVHWLIVGGRGPRAFRGAE